MFTVQRSLSALVFCGLLVAGGPALAADEPVATADANTPSVAAQIDDYLKTSPAIDLPKDTATGITPGEEEPRKVHGVVDVAVGTHGYRSAYVRSDFPVGKTGTLSIAVEDTQFKGRFGGYGYGGYGGYGGFGSQPYRSQNVALGLAFGGAAQGDADRRCRDAIGGLGRHRIDPMLTGPMDSDRSYACDRRDAPPEGR
jgi:hypothetical protein